MGLFGAVPARAQTATTLVHLEGAKKEVALQWLDPSTGKWFNACHGTCDKELPTDFQYRIGGVDVRSSAPFRLSGPRASYRVRAASPDTFKIGVVAAVVGALATGAGVAAFVAGNSSPNESCAGFLFGGGGCNFGRSLAIGFGGVVATTGASMILVGVVLMALNAKTFAIEW